MEQDETESEESYLRVSWGYLTWPLVLMVLYALSAGPVLRSYYKGSLSRSSLHVYRPLMQAVHIFSLEDPFELYVELCCRGAAYDKGPPFYYPLEYL